MDSLSFASAMILATGIGCRNTLGLLKGLRISCPTALMEIRTLTVEGDGGFRQFSFNDAQLGIGLQHDPERSRRTISKQAVQVEKWAENRILNWNPIVAAQARTIISVL